MGRKWLLSIFISKGHWLSVISLVHTVIIVRQITQELSIKLLSNFMGKLISLVGGGYVLLHIFSSADMCRNAEVTNFLYMLIGMNRKLTAIIFLPFHIWNFLADKKMPGVEKQSKMYQKHSNTSLGGKWIQNWINKNLHFLANYKSWNSEYCQNLIDVILLVVVLIKQMVRWAF